MYVLRCNVLSSRPGVGFLCVCCFLRQYSSIPFVAVYSIFFSLIKLYSLLLKNK